MKNSQQVGKQLENHLAASSHISTAQISLCRITMLDFVSVLISLEPLEPPWYHAFALKHTLWSYKICQNRRSSLVQVVSGQYQLTLQLIWMC